MGINNMRAKMDRLFKRETPKSFRRWLHKNREDTAYENKKRDNYEGELSRSKRELQENIESLICEFSGKFPGLFVFVEHALSTSNYSDHYTHSVNVETSINNTGKPIKLNNQ